MSNPEQQVQRAARALFTDMPTEQLVRLNLAMLLSPSSLPKTDGYETIKTLLTENGGTQFHPLVEAVWHQVIIERIGE